MRNLTGGLLTFAATSMAVSALAQTPAEDSAAANGTEQRQADAQKADKPSGRRAMEEVIVTAQKRAERLEDVPISISVLDGAELDRSTVQSAAEALNRVPGVAATVSALGTPQVIVRGVTTAGLALNGSSPVAYYVDSTPFGFVKSALVPDSNTYDLERIEVLRGPQGTLYGASALNGVVRILTKDADPEKVEFKARTSASSTEDGAESYRADLAVNLPIVEKKLAARMVVGYQDVGGWIDRPNEEDANDVEIKNLRLKVNANVTDQLSIGASAWLSRSDSGAQSISDDDRRNSSLAEEPVEADYDAYGFKIGYEFSGASLSSMTSYLDYANASTLDLVLFAFPTLQVSAFDSKVFSQELVLNSTHGGPWRWSIGGMYRDAEDRRRSRLLSFPTSPPIDYNDLSESTAVFGELTRILLDGKLELTGGLRYFEDDVTTKENLSFTGSPTAALIERSNTFDSVTPRVVVTIHPSERSTFYASYAEGFRSGFPQNPNIVGAAPQFPPVDADTLQSYEIGMKGNRLDGHLSFDMAVFYMDWQDVQQTLSVLIGGFPRNVIINSGSASGMGVDFAASITPVEGLDLGINFGWNDLTMDRDVISGVAVLFREGDRLNLSPELTVGASADYVFPIGGRGLEGRFSASANYISEQEVHTIAMVGTGDSMLIARTGFSLMSPNHWTATLFVDNVNDEDGAAVRQPFLFRDWDARARPRTVVLQLDYSF